MTDWKAISSAPHDGTAVLIWDGFGVVQAQYLEPCSLEEWWDDVGDEDEEPDTDGYAEYRDAALDGWCAFSGDEVMFLNPSHWMPMPTPPLSS